MSPPTPIPTQNGLSSKASLPSSSLIHTSNFATRQRHLLDLTNQLRSFGSQLDVDLPCITIIGSQSVGKSSLIEAISGIQVPRSSGTCTRCPMEIRLVRSEGEENKFDHDGKTGVNGSGNYGGNAKEKERDDAGEISSDSEESWSCRIALRFEKSKDGKPLGRVLEIPFGEIITNPKEVESRLRQAQLAILNPTTSMDDHNSYLSTTNNNDTNELSFSPNIICVTIVSPSLVDLTFVDLPGLISATKEIRDEKNIEIIEDLVTDYIQRENCLILTTLAMTADIETQKATMLTRKYDPTGKRTINVLTKPDQLSPGDEKTWVDLIIDSLTPHPTTSYPTFNNSLPHKSKTPYFVTKHRNTFQLENQITLKEAKKLETEFFKNSKPWKNWNDISSVSPELGKRLGTGNLVWKLSEVLSELTEDRLPSIKEEIKTQLSQVTKELRQLPSQPSSIDPTNDLLILCHSIGSEIASYIHGTTNPTNDYYSNPNSASLERMERMSLVKEEKKMALQLKQKMARTRPRFCPFSRDEKKKGKKWESTVPVGSGNKILQKTLQEPDSIMEDLEVITDGLIDPEEEEDGEAEQSGRPVPSSVTETEREEREKNNSKKIRDFFDPENWMKGEVVFMDLDDIREHIDNARGRGLPFDIPATAKRDLMSKPIPLWRQIAVESFEQLRPAFEKLVSRLVKNKFSRYSNGRLERAVNDIIKPLIDENATTTLEKIEEMIQLETDIWTANDHYLSANRHLNLSYFRKVRHPPPSASEPGGERSVFGGGSQVGPAASAKPPSIFASSNSAMPFGTHILTPPPATNARTTLTAAGDDAYEPELILAAEVLAYYKVAQKRVIDNICLTIHCHFILPFVNPSKGLTPALMKGLGLGLPGAKEKCAEFMEENYAIRTRREQLCSMKERLENASRTLKDI